MKTRLATYLRLEYLKIFCRFDQPKTYTFQTKLHDKSVSITQMFTAWTDVNI